MTVGTFCKLVYLNIDFECHCHDSIHFPMPHTQIRQAMAVGTLYRQMQNFNW